MTCTECKSSWFTSWEIAKNLTECPFCHSPLYEEKAEQIYKDTKVRDLIKDNFCREHNIVLLRIPYWKVNNISEVLNEFLRNLGRI